MKRPKPLPCPFCGKKPSGKKFCSTDRGPVLICDNCAAEGPPPLPEDQFFGGMKEENRLKGKAIAAWNARATPGAKPVDRGRDKRERRKRRKESVPGFIAASVLPRERRGGQGRRLRDLA